MNQQNESDKDLFILIGDDTYDSDEWEEEREKFRLGLETEFQSKFIDANIGPGADMPAFLTILTEPETKKWALLFLIFFAGKKINENIDAWIEIASKIRRFFPSRRVFLARNGAAALAVEAVANKVGPTKDDLKIKSYTKSFPYEDNEESNKPDIILENTPTMFLGVTVHVFEFYHGNEVYKVTVFMNEVDIMKVK